MEMKLKKATQKNSSILGEVEGLSNQIICWKFCRGGSGNENGYFVTVEGDVEGLSNIC